VPRRELLAVLLVGAAGLGVLAGCRTSPSVAAYVGEEQVTVAELDDAVAERLADPGIASYVGEDEAGFTRQVLTAQVVEEVYAAAARRYDVQVTDADVESRIVELLQGNDPEAVYAQIAQQQGANREDVVENVRQLLLRTRIAEAAGQVDVSEQALRARYDQSREALTTIEFGYVTVPDQPTADDVLARLTADPAGYAAVAAQYPGNYTLPQVDTQPVAQLPGVLANALATAGPGQGFTLPVAETGGVVVGFVRAVVVPSFEQARDQLAQQAAEEANDAGAALVAAVGDDLDVDVNPRFGVLDEGRVVAGEGGVVRLLSDADATGADGAGTGAAGD
jgi:peptidyl-prolyl cis-trans isomerase SurA